MNDLYKTIQEHNPNKKRKILIAFDNMIADILNTQSCFDVSKNVKQNSMHYFVMEIPSKKKVQEISFNNSSDIYFQDLLNPYKRCTEK